VGGPVPLGPGAIWDERWRIDGPAGTGHEVRALGEAGWRQIGEKPPGTPPFAAALSLPAVFDGERLVAALHFGFGPACGIALMPDRGPLVAGSKAH
jgi:tRNA(Ile)-lysidine synthase